LSKEQIELSAFFAMFIDFGFAVYYNGSESASCFGFVL